MDYQFLAGILLFQGLSPDVLPDLLAGLGAGTRFYPRGEAVLRPGDRTGRLGLVLTGGVNIENHDAWGNRTILDHVAPGQVFAETYACVPGEPLMVDVAGGPGHRGPVPGYGPALVRRGTPPWNSLAQSF